MYSRAEVDCLRETLQYVCESTNGSRELSGVHNDVARALFDLDDVEDRAYARRSRRESPARATVAALIFVPSLAVVVVGGYLAKSALGIDLFPGESMFHGIYETFRERPADSGGAGDGGSGTFTDGTAGIESGDGPEGEAVGSATEP